jgi:hypothetical protein
LRWVEKIIELKIFGGVWLLGILFDLIDNCDGLFLYGVMDKEILIY